MFMSENSHALLLQMRHRS